MNRKKLNIAMVGACPLPANNGTSSRILRMSEGLLERGHNVEIITYPVGDSSIDYDSRLKIHRIRPPFKYSKTETGPTREKPFLDLQLSIKIKKILAQKEFDIVHCHHLEGFVSSLPASKITDTPCIFDAHTDVMSELIGHGLFPNNAILERTARTMEKKIYSKADGIITVSERLKSYFTKENIMKKEDVHVVSTGIDLENFTAVEEISFQKDFPKENLVIYTGNLDPYQGFENLLKAMKYVVEEISDAILLVVGDEGIDKYEDMSSRLEIENSVIFEGTQPFSKMPSYLNLADVAVSPRTEPTGFPQKILNYMAMGLPTVSFEASAKPINNEKEGIIVQNHNINDFANGIVSLLRDKKKARRLGRNARKKVMEYRWEKLAKKIERVYKNILTNQKESLVD